MNAAIIGTSKKENEKRVAIHPRHIGIIPQNIRTHLFFEKGYGVPFGMNDEEISFLTGNSPVDRKTLLHASKAIIIPKPVEEDFKEMQANTAVWGWIHSVQNSNITQIAVDKKLTLFAWENMNNSERQSRTHIFQRNNEMAGYCGVQHALQLRGIDGNFGSSRKVVVLSFGSVSRGAVYALIGHGFRDITILTQRPVHLVSDKIPGLQYKSFVKEKTGLCKSENFKTGIRPFLDELAEADIIVNGILQNPNDPIVFIHDEDIMKFKKECLVIDISCDKNMGFSFAGPTDFSKPLRKIGNILYYAVDHTPSILWDSASWEISKSLIPYLKDFIEQRENPVLNNAVDIRDGVVINKNILTYQNRSPIYPYKRQENTSQDINAHQQYIKAENTQGKKIS